MSKQNGNGRRGYGDESAFEPPQLAPHSQDAEEAVLGSILINQDAYLEAARFITPDDFFILRNAYVWEAMTSLHQRGEIIDYLTVIEELRSRENAGGNRLEDVGGAAYITYLTSNVGTSIYAGDYAAFVERYSLRRKMLTASTEIARLAREGEDAYQAYEQGRQFYDAQASRRLARSGLRSISQAISEHFDRVEYLYGNPNVLPGIPTGFKDLDDLQEGARDTDLIILAGRPGMGKTALLLNILMSAGNIGKRGAFFSLEMSERQLLDRIIAMESGIPSNRIRDGRLSEQEWRRYIDATRLLSELHIQIDDTPNQSLSQIRTKCFYLRNLRQLDFIFVDYLQLIGSAKSEEDRIKQVGDNVQALKNLARELKVPIWCASQLSRAVEQRQDKRPQMSDLSESGRIEQSADQILFLYRDEYYNPNSDRLNEADVHLAKNRHGATGTIGLFFRKSLTQFTNLKKTDVNLENF